MVGSYSYYWGYRRARCKPTKIGVNVEVVVEGLAGSVEAIVEIEINVPVYVSCKFEVLETGILAELMAEGDDEGATVVMLYDAL